ncbi:MAG TPA: amidohydrolase family protein [Patescibacteria group bacterium]|nr:amidohydrolase family protein [Patescibacteria group bacterium]
MRIDSHQHFWNYSSAEYPWIDSQWPIRRDFLPADLEPELLRNQLDGSVAVQARQSLEETRWLLQLAESFPLIKGVVGWVDLRSPAVEQQLGEFASHPRFVGVRHVVQDEPDDRFMLREDFQRGIGTLRKFGLTYDILIYPRQLPAALELAQSFPEQPFVLDHLAKPFIRDRAISPWSEEIRRLARCPNVMCKASGLVTEAKWHQWHLEDFQPYLQVVFEAFGPDRLMFGSDWPVGLLSASYEQAFSLVRHYVLQYDKQAESKVFGVNAVRFYDL